MKIFSGSFEGHTESFLHVGYMSAPPTIFDSLGDLEVWSDLSPKGQTAMPSAMLIVGLGLAMTCKIRNGALHWLAIGMILGGSLLGGLVTFVIR